LFVLTYQFLLFLLIAFSVIRFCGLSLRHFDFPDFIFNFLDVFPGQFDFPFDVFALTAFLGVSGQQFIILFFAA
jgi:hypothetical protein